MLTNLKALIVVLAISMSMFALARPMCLGYMDAAAFARRRNVWVALTVTAFLSPSIWLYALVALPLMYWGAKKDDSPLAFYVLLSFAVPSVSVQIPTIGIGQVFELNQHRMMSLAILVPLMFGSTRTKGMAAIRTMTAMDWTLVAFGALQLVLVMPYESPTNTLRRGVVFFLDTFVVFYVFARLEPTAKALKEIVATFSLVVAILAALAVFESFRGWLLYVGIGPVWGAPDIFTAYLIRGNLLRAQVSTGHSLRFGYMAAMGLGVWFYLSRHESRRLAKVTGLVLLCSGVLVSGSRGAWVTAALLYAAYMALRPDAARYFTKALPVLVIVLVIAFNSPLKESVIDRLPIIGSTDQDTVDYRQQVADVSWRLVKQNPIFGDPFALRDMEELRQGQGIIDIMNGYANVAVFSGGVGLGLFVLIFAIALWRCYVAMRFFQLSDSDMASLGANLIACLLASLFFIGTAGIEPATYWLTGLMACYVSVASACSNGGAFVPIASGSL